MYKIAEYLKSSKLNFTNTNYKKLTKELKDISNRYGFGANMPRESIIKADEKKLVKMVKTVLSDLEAKIKHGEDHIKEYTEYAKENNVNIDHILNDNKKSTQKANDGIKMLKAVDPKKGYSDIMKTTGVLHRVIKENSLEI